MVGSLDEMNLKQPGIGDLVHGDVDGPFDWHETLARVVEMIPGWSISHAADQCGSIAFQAKLAAVKRMFCGVEYPCSFRALVGSEPPFLSLGGDSDSSRR